MLGSDTVQIRTRLPAPEANFQNDQPVQMDFLHEAMTHKDRGELPPWAKCIMLYSLFGQSILNQRLAMSETTSSGNDSRKSWSKYTWLALGIEKRKGSLIHSPPGSLDIVDHPMLNFAGALAACAATHIYHCMAQSAFWSTPEDENIVPPYKEQAIQAACELVRFIEFMPRPISCFKAHPFLPTLIYRAAHFLIGLSRASSPPMTTSCNREGDIGILLGALRDLEQVNNLSRILLSKLEKQVPT